MTALGQSSEIAHATSTRFALRTTQILLYLVPVAYLSLVATVIIHEVIGHGLVALALGGQFSGFVVGWDGSGWAYAFARSDAPSWHNLLISASGAAVNLVFGLVGFAIAWCGNNKFFTRMTLLVFSLINLLEAGVYVFLSCCYPVPPSDFGWILTAFPNPVARWVLLVVSGAISIISLLVIYSLLIQEVEKWFGPEARLTDFRRALLLTLIIVIPGIVGWGFFSWEEVLPGIGSLPQFILPLCHVACAFFLYWFTGPSAETPPLRIERPWIPLLIVWVATGLALFAMARWLSPGLMWGGDQVT